MAARRAAAAAVAATFAKEATLDDALARHRTDSDALTRAIAVTTFRRFGTIRAAILARLDKGLPDDSWVLAVLATGAAQLLFMEVADHAAVDLAVRLVNTSKRTRHLAGLVNAVLRRVAREREAILAASDPVADLPGWIADRWIATYGPERTEAIAAAHRLGGALDLTCRSDPSGWAGRLDGVLLPTGSVRVSDRRKVDSLPGYTEGAWWVQDAAAAIPARLLGVQPGERVLDMCAAPGGKTAQFAAAGALVTALDKSPPRLSRVAENLSRLKLDATLKGTDALVFKAEPFDAVLLDAPCTATGTIRRHPDIAWTKTEDDLASLVDLQRRLLDRAADLVRPGGRLVYCVCSLEPEEGEDQAAAFLARNPRFRRRPIEAGTFGLGPDLLTRDGDLRTAPDLWPAVTAPEGETDVRPGLDGFFAVSMLKDDA